MLRRTVISLFVLAVLLPLQPIRAQQDPTRLPRGCWFARAEIIDDEMVQVLDLASIVVFSQPADMRKHQRLVNNVRKTYPIALDAHRRFQDIEKELATISSSAEQREYLIRMEKELMKEYTPILKKMSFSQGKILLKLIDRQIGVTSYDIIKELRGSFHANLWQGVAKLFEADLQQTYDKEGEDKIIEQIIMMYEAGLL